MVNYNPRSIDQMYEQYSKTHSSKSDNANKTFAESMKAGGGGRNMSGAGSSAMEGLMKSQREETQKDSNNKVDKNEGVLGNFFSKFFGAAEANGLEFVKPDKPKPSIYDRDDMKPIDIDAQRKRIDDAVNFDLAKPLPSMNFKDDEYAASTYDEVQPLEGADTYKDRRITAQGINDTIKGLMDTEQRQTDIRQAVNKTIDSLRSADAEVPYVIQAGDTLSDIAVKTGTTVQDLVKTNNIKDKNKIYTGNQLIIPTDKTVKSKEEVVNNLVENYELRISTRGDEDPDSQFYQSGVTMDQRTFPAETVEEGLMSKRPKLRPEASDISNQKVFDKIMKGESTDFNDISNTSKIKPPKPITEMTVAEVREWQDKSVAAGSKSSSVGRYQIIRDTMDDLIAKGAIDEDDVFNEETQNKAFQSLLDRRRYSESARKIKLTKDKAKKKEIAEDLQNRLAMEFASVPVATSISAGTFGKDRKGNPIPKVDLKPGDTFYKDPSDPNLNKALHEYDDFLKVLTDIK